MQELPLHHDLQPRLRAAPRRAKKGADWAKEDVLEIVEPSIRRHFRPEFINRLDEILPFLPLQEKDMEKIVHIQLDHVKKRLAEKEISLEVAPAVIAHLAKEGYDPIFGARPLKRLIQHKVVNLLSSALLKGELQPTQTVKLNLEKGLITYKV